MRLKLCVVGLASLALIACTKGPPSSGIASLPEVPVVAPFDQMHLPTEGGKVVACTGPSGRMPATIRVAYDGGDKAALGARYTSAVIRGPWMRRSPATDTPQRWFALYDDADTTRTLTLQVVDSDFAGQVPHGLEVSVTIMTPVAH